MDIGIIIAAIAVPLGIEMWLGSSSDMYAAETGVLESMDEKTGTSQVCWVGALVRIGLMILTVTAVVIAG